ncbi:hypothetical protein M758_11G088800 [Ceratodon purpureus]|nr:hypothetical protein M758_11G088800 [Ceratodon purpureus]
MASSLMCRCPCTTIATTSSKSIAPKTSFLPQAGANFVKSGVRTGRGKRALVVRALELDQDTLVAISVGVAGLAVGIGVPIFYESQVKSSESRENDQPCFPCKGTGNQVCRFCVGAGNITVELGGGEREVSKCINCEGSGSLTCTTCQGTGVQPRYLDRREYKDDD